MGLQFDQPLMLLALVLVPAAAWLGARSRRLSPSRRRWSVILRALVLTLVVLALARPRLVRPVDARSVAFLVDASDSVPRQEAARAEAFVAEAVDGMEADDRAAVVVFADRPLMDRAARSGPLEAFRSVPGGGRTDIGAALRLGLAALPADTARRLVVLSDGRSNEGNLARQAELAAASGLPVDVVPLAAAASDEEVLVRALEAPANSRVGGRFDLTAVVRSGGANRARLQLSSENEVLFDELVELAPGDNRFSVPVTVDEPGFREYHAVITPDRDGRTENNVASTFTLAAGPPKILVVAHEPDRAEPLVRALESAEREPVLAGPSGLPSQLLGLAEYDAVVLVDVPARELSRDAMLALEAFVRDLGHGLVMIGGEDSFGAGGYRHTPVEKAMPVEMEVRDKESRPDIALAFVIDRSGSMSELAGGGLNKLDLAKEAVLQASLLFRPEDQVALVAFDDRAYDVWPLGPHDAPSAFESAAAGIEVGGGTNIYSGLAAAVDQLEGAEAAVKHVILLSDGWSDTGGYDRVLSRMDDAGITLSIVAVGEGSAEYLADLAERGGGRYYPVAYAEDVPQIFVEETMTTLGTYVIEERFQPVPGASTDVLSGLDPERLRPLSGYNGTTAKQSARVALWSHLDDPVLAQWQYGLGRALAWTSDLKAQWASDWVGWDGFAPFAVQLVDWTLPAPDTEGFAATATVDGGAATISLRAADEAGGAVNFLDVEARMSGPGGQGLVVPLEQAAAGEYSGRVELAEQGTYLVRVVGSVDGEVVGAQTLGLVVPYSPEYADASEAPTDPRLYQVAERTGGRVMTEPEGVLAEVADVTTASPIWHWLLLAAVIVFPLDVAARRLKLRRSDLSVAAARLRGGVRRSPAGADGREPVLGSLFEARDRARHRREGVGEVETAASDAAAEPSPHVPVLVMPARVRDESDEPAVPDVDPTEGEDDTETDTLSRLREAKRRAKRGE